MANLRLKLDENMQGDLAGLLAARGYDVADVFSEGLSGHKDRQVLTAAASEGRLLVTLDLDFADLRRHPPAAYAGILVLRPGSEGIKSVLALLLQTLPRLTPEGVRGALVVASPRSLRLRHNLDQGDVP
jgi:predicted nuclease of predicted toxin-antitoxin system